MMPSGFFTSCTITAASWPSAASRSRMARSATSAAFSRASASCGAASASACRTPIAVDAAARRGEPSMPSRRPRPTRARPARSERVEGGALGGDLFGRDRARLAGADCDEHRLERAAERRLPRPGSPASARRLHRRGRQVKPPEARRHEQHRAARARQCGRAASATSASDGTSSTAGSARNSSSSAGSGVAKEQLVDHPLHAAAADGTPPPPSASSATADELPAASVAKWLATRTAAKYSAEHEHRRRRVDQRRAQDASRSKRLRFRIA